MRTQIVRGLDVLRRQLPRGLVAGLVVVMLDAPALRAMRACVLRRGAEVVPTTVAAVSSGLALAVVGAGTVHKKLAFVGAVAVLVAMGFWIAGPSPGEGGEGEVPPEAPQLVASQLPSGSAAARSSARPAVVTRRERADPSSPTTGSLEVIVRWQNDDVPARGQAITVVHAGETLGELRSRSVVTDGEGSALFGTVPPGAITVQASTGVRQAAEVTAGQRSTVTLRLEGTAVLGQVVDHLGVPVADADVWVSSEIFYTPVRTGDVPAHGQYGQLTLRTDEQGRFETRMKGLQCLAAFKKGHGPSLTLYPLRGRGRSPQGPIAVVLRLQPEGGTLTVAVRGRNDAPLANAMVLAGPEVPSLTGEAHQATTPAQRASTDQAGVATLEPLPVGRMSVQVRAPGYGPWRGEVDILPGGTSSLDVALVDGGIVTGVVHDGVGKPLAAALIHHGRWSSLQASMTTTDSGGAYRLEHLPVGEVELVAFHEDWGKVTAKVTVVAGATARWDVRMPPRAAITGFVFDHEGQPAGGCYVTCFSPALDEGATTHADAAGRFVLSPLEPGRSYEVTAEVSLRGGGLAHPSRSAVPAGSEIELRVASDHVPTARLRGRVLQADGKPAVGCQVHASPVDGSPGSMHDIGADGRFEFGPWSPQRLGLSVQRIGDPIAIGDFGVHEMREGATTEVGDLVLPATGSARIRITGGEAEQGVAALFRDGRHVAERRITDEPVAWEGLPPGDYAVCVTRVRGVPLCGFAEFELVPGRVNEVTVAVAAGNRRDVRIETANSRHENPTVNPTASPAETARPPTHLVGGRTVVLRATDAAHRTVMMKWTMPAPDGSPAAVVLPTAAVELTAASEDGWGGSAIVGEASAEPIVVRLGRK
ncbi:MAG TPA: carboxypeptidase-like regulatory domain-containing protein [Planctomycetota bacterium]|nr:carboxypeptidase-like regulatory domain-containing protein [Planctomycetota bacterium]